MIIYIQLQNSILTTKNKTTEKNTCVLEKVVSKSFLFPFHLEKKESNSTPFPDL